MPVYKAEVAVTESIVTTLHQSRRTISLWRASEGYNRPSLHFNVACHERAASSDMWVPRSLVSCGRRYTRQSRVPLACVSVCGAAGVACRPRYRSVHPAHRASRSTGAHRGCGITRSVPQWRAVCVHPPAASRRRVAGEEAHRGFVEGESVLVTAPDTSNESAFPHWMTLADNRRSLDCFQ